MDTRTIRLLDYDHLLASVSQMALSEPGAKACRQLRPLPPERLQAETALLREALDRGADILKAVTSFPNLDGVLAYLDREAFVDEDGLWAVQLVLQAVQQAVKTLSGLDEAAYPNIQNLLQNAAWPEKTWQALNRCLDPEGGLRDESSPELLEIRQEVRRIHSQCTKKVHDYLEQENINGYLQDEFLTISADRYVLAIKANFKGRLQGIIHDYSQTGETCYFEPLLLVELNNTLQELKNEEREARQRVLRWLSSLINQERQRVQAAYAWIVSLDLLRVKVSLAQALSGECVLLSHDQDLRLRQARHPLLALNQEQVKPVDIELQPGQCGLIISGGNSGGKTVCLKTLGLISLMALSALPVPVQEGSTLPLWDKIFVFIGDEQSLQEHQSTFTAQIDHFQADWPRMDASSLVLLDEFGAGTDPSQGAALAQAVMDALLDRSVWVVAATHFPALKAYGLTKDKARAATVLFDPDTQLPLYTLGYDQVGGSRALDVAREHGLPAEILHQAESYLLLDGKDSGQLMQRLNDLAVAREQEVAKLQQERAALEDEYRQRRAKLDQQAQRLLEEVREHARSVIREWRAGKMQRKQALRALAEDKGHLKQALGTEDKSPEPSMAWTELKPGDQVAYSAWGKTGVVQEVDERKERIKLDLGGVQVWVPAAEVTPGSARKATGSEISSSKAPTSGASLGMSLDLRGMRAEEARLELTRCVDQALLQGRKELEVIHGRGTGILRETVRQELDRLHGIAGYTLASEQRGGDGVTIVELE